MANQEKSAIIAQSAASTGVNGADQDGCNATGILIFVNVTAITGTSPTYTVTLQGKAPGTTQYYTILQSAPISTTGLTVLKVYPGLPVTANLSASDILPPTFRINTATGGTTPSVTATISCSLIL